MTSQSYYASAHSTFFSFLIAIKPAPKTGSKVDVSRYYKRNGPESRKERDYQKIYYFADVKGTDGEGWCIFERNIDDKALFWGSTSGPEIAIGTCIAIVEPLPFKNKLLADDLPIVQTMISWRILKDIEISHRPYPSLANTHTRFFMMIIKDKSHINFKSLTFCASVCTGTFCDRQKVNQTQNSLHYENCGCYQLTNRDSGVATVAGFPSITIKLDSVNETIHTKPFQSLRFSRLLFKTKFPSVSHQEANSDDNRILVRKAWIKINQYVFDHGGWMIAGRRKIPQIVNASAITNEEHTTGEPSITITYLQPCNKMITTTPEFQALQLSIADDGRTFIASTQTINQAPALESPT
jgi:hypothetical protein